MLTRTTEKSVTFQRPFALSAFDEVLPAGTYTVATDEELMEGASFSAYRRVQTVIQVHPPGEAQGVLQSVPIDPRELESALLRDAAHAAALK